MIQSCLFRTLTQATSGYHASLLTRQPPRKPLQITLQHGKLAPHRRALYPRQLAVLSHRLPVTSERCESGRIGQSRKLLSG